MIDIYCIIIIALLFILCRLQYIIANNLRKIAENYLAPIYVEIKKLKEKK